MKNRDVSSLKFSWKMFVFSTSVIAFWSLSAQCQIIPDNTLGGESSVVTPQELQDLISGGAIRGENLFHSFTEFNVNNGQNLYFLNPDGITNIFTRVTGNNLSNIFGTLGVSGDANLFLINPNGIVFGNNAKLDMNGSFFASTAESLIFNNYEFSSINPDAPPLLTINLTPGLQSGKINPETNINNQGVLEASKITLEAGKVSNTGFLTAPEGIITVTAKDINFSGTIEGELLLQADNDITFNGNLTVESNYNFTATAGRSVTVKENSILNLSNANFTVKINNDNVNSNQRENGIATFTMNTNSSILTEGENITIESGNFSNTSQINTLNGEILNFNSSNTQDNVGNINLSALGDIKLGNISTKPNNFPETNYQGGNITITSIDGSIFAKGQEVGINSTSEPKNLVISAGKDIIIEGSIANIGTETVGQTILKSGGNIILNGGIIDTQIRNGNFTLGNQLEITASSFQAKNSSITATTFNGDGGNILVNVESEVNLENSRLLSASLGLIGDSGDITLNTKRLTLYQTNLVDDINFFKSGISAEAELRSSGNGGNIVINSSELIEVVGIDPEPFNPTFSNLLVLANDFFADIHMEIGISTSALGGGKSGDLTVNTGDVIIRNGAAFSTISLLGEGGDITVNARDFFLENKAIITTGTQGKDAGDINIQADRIDMINGGFIGTTTNGLGNSGNLTLSIPQINLESGSILATTTIAQGNGGLLTINNGESINITGISADGLVASGIKASSLGTGNAGNIIINSDSITLFQGGEIVTNSINEGKGGNIELNLSNLLLDNSTINASTTTNEAGGNIEIIADESVTVKGAGLEFLRNNIIEFALGNNPNFANLNQGILTITGGEGNAGNVLIETPNFVLDNGGFIATSTLAKGEGGNITINAIDTLEINNSLLATGTFSTAPSGDINLNSRQLIARGGAQAITTTFSSGKAGNLTVNVTDSIDLIDLSETGIASGLFASSFEIGTGTGGDITITTGDFNIINRAAVSVSGEGDGNAGNIYIQANSIFLDNGLIIASSNSGEGGNITLDIKDNLILRNNSNISTRAGIESMSGGDGGNININAGFVITVPTENSDITANAFAGNGGNININTQRVFGLELQDSLTENSDINASSQFGNNGDILVTTWELDPTSGIIKLPENILDSANQIVTGCPTDIEANFVVTGRSGLPPNPLEELQEKIYLNAFETDFKMSSEDNQEYLHTRTIPEGNYQFPLIEAQEWMINEKGKIELVASKSISNLDIPQNDFNYCQE